MTTALPANRFGRKGRLGALNPCIAQLTYFFLFTPIFLFTQDFQFFLFIAHFEPF